jgi:hypothetical protein
MYQGRFFGLVEGSQFFDKLQTLVHPNLTWLLTSLLLQIQKSQG